MKIPKPNFKRYNWVVLIVLFFAQAYYYNLDELIFVKPQSLHLMRQTNCLSMAQNYFQKDISLWKPEIHNHFCDEGLSGKSAAEFPIIYYFVGHIWKYFGKSEGFFRIINLGILLIGLLALFEIAKELFKNSWFAGFLVLLLFTSPMLVFYSMNFLPNGPSFGMVLLAWYFIFRFHKIKKTYYLWIATLLFSLAIVVKIAAAISFIALIGWLIFENIFRKKEERIIPMRLLYVVQIVVVFLLSFGWYYYVEYYNKLHKGAFSFHGIWPVWDMNKEMFDKVIENIRVIFFKDYFLSTVQYITLALWIVVLVFWKKLNDIQKFFTVVLPLGAVMYLALWFQVLEAHDYYLINLLIVFAFIWLQFFYLIRNKKLWNHPLFYALLGGLLLYSTYHCNNQLEERHKGWMNDWYDTKLETLTELAPIFKECGITVEDKVISIPDLTVCSSLYLMGRCGYTDFASDFSKDEIFRKRIEQGAKYLIINDTTILGKEVLQPYLRNEIAVFKNVRIYDLQDIIK